MDIATEFTWSSQSWDTVHPIMYLYDGETPRISYMLWDNPDDWDTFVAYAESEPDVATVQTADLVNYQSYALRLICDMRAISISAPETGTAVDQAACCIMDQSSQKGGGYCL